MNEENTCVGPVLGIGFDVTVETKEGFATVNGIEDHSGLSGDVLEKIRSGLGMCSWARFSASKLSR